MKRVISIFLILVILASIFAVYAAAGFDSSGFSYDTDSNNNATITKWLGSGSSVTIPATVQNGGTTYKVTKINDYVFAGKPNLSSVSLGSNLKTIGKGAFSTNRSCTSLTIPASVETIGARAFHSWVALSSLTFASGSKISTIDKWAFRNAQSLSRINFPDKESGSITISEAAFSYCNSISSVVFPKCVSTIGEEAFIGCTNLASVTIRNKTASIGSNAFDLTASQINTSTNLTRRTLSINGYAGSTAKTFANAEGFTFNTLPPEPTEDEEQSVPTAGKYYVRVTVNCVNKRGTSKESEKHYVQIWCRNLSGGTSYSKQYCCLTKDNTTENLDFALPGAPYEVKFYLYGSSTGYVEGYVEKITLSTNSDYTTGAITLMSGKVGCNIATWMGGSNYAQWTLPNTFSKRFDGKIGSDQTNTINTGWNSLSGQAPVISSIDALTDGVTEAAVNTDGTNYRAPYAFTLGKVRDQYGVVAHQLPTISVGTSAGAAVTGVSVETNFRRLVLTPAANRANYYYVYVKQTAGTVSKNKAVKIKTFDYNVTFSYFEGTKAKTVTQTVNYGASPTDPGVTPVKYNSDGHQLFDGWSDEATATYTDGPQEVTAVAKYKAIASHNLSEPVEDSPATCTEAQQMKETCADCGYDKITEGDPALGHTGDNVVSEIAPTDNTPGIAYFTCTACNTCWSAIKNNGVFTKDVSSELEPVNGQPNIAQIIQDAPQENIMTPAPAFNRFTDTTLNNYNYSLRGGSLKIAGDSNIDLSSCANNSSSPLLTSVTQGMRFTASMHIPDGVSLSDTGSGNRLTDFGYVWSQTNLINANENIANLEEGKTRVYKTSVVNNNSGNGTFTGSNWTGVSTHDDDLGGSGKTLTFNLVVNVKAKNWKKAYCARAYIKYVYNDKEYTVYDSGFSSRSVAAVAPLVAASEYESQRVKTYCQNKIVNNLSYLPE